MLPGVRRALEGYCLTQLIVLNSSRSSSKSVAPISINRAVNGEKAASSARPSLYICDSLDRVHDQYVLHINSCGAGAVDIDNSAAERALRGVAIGRRNYLFADIDSGGERPLRSNR